MCLGSMGDAFSDCMDTTTLAGLGNDSRYFSRLDGSICPQSTFPSCGSRFTEQRQNIQHSGGSTVLLLDVDIGQDRLHEPLWAEFRAFARLVGEKYNDGRY